MAFLIFESLFFAINSSGLRPLNLVFDLVDQCNLACPQCLRAPDLAKDYENFIFAVDFNCEETEQHLRLFLDQYHAFNIVKEKTCYKSINRPSCIDLFITNRNRSFQNTITLSTGISDFHKMVINCGRQLIGR